MIRVLLKDGGSSQDGMDHCCCNACCIAFGFVIMDKLDKFIASPNFIPDSKMTTQDENESKGALVFGRLDLSDEIIELLEKNNISYSKIVNFNQLNKSASYKYLFAVDEIDLENFMICSFCEKMMGITKRIAICNCFDNLKIFKDNRIPFLCGYSISASSLVAELIPFLHEDGGKSNVQN